MYINTAIIHLVKKSAAFANITNIKITLSANNSSRIKIAITIITCFNYAYS